MAQISGRFPEKVRQRLKMRVAEDGTSIQTVLEDAILDYLESRGENVHELRSLVVEYRERGFKGDVGAMESRQSASGE